MAYFTCSRLGGPLARLPPAEPALIATAQRVKRFLTGRLDAPVSAYPPFAGTEAQLLAAQARRIRILASVHAHCPSQGAWIAEGPRTVILLCDECLERHSTHALAAAGACPVRSACEHKQCTM